MDIEHLSKTQIVMLALLVAFVSSIATGIVTVSLVSQAPTGITQTINRIVEHTVEKVVTEPAKSVAAAVGVTTSPPPAVASSHTETTVVIKDDDLAANSIATAQRAIVKIVEKGAPESAFYARGVIIDKTGTIVTDKSALDPNLGVEAIFPKGERRTLTPRAPVAGSAVLIYDPNFTGTTSPDFTPVTFTDVSKLKLGQQIIRIGGKDKDAVSTGVIASVPDTSVGSDHLIETNVNATVPGGILITSFGELVGITTGESLASGGTFYTTIDEVSAALNAKK